MAFYGPKLPHIYLINIPIALSKLLYYVNLNLSHFKSSVVSKPLLRLVILIVLMPF